MAKPSSGTLTFLFTDIEASTQRWQNDRGAMAHALARHDDLLRSIVDANDGSIFKHTGDGICAVFTSARSAVTAARDAQDELELPVRMGLHTGEAQERDGDYYGPTLNRCARIMDLGHGGQILVSAATHALADDIESLDLGEHSLRGIARPERVLQIGHDEYPPLRSGDRKVPMPAVLSSLLGREALVSDVVGRSKDARLVTLVGVGGVGKTRVAIAAAERLRDEHDLSVFVDLTEVSDDGEVLAALARSLDLTTSTRRALSIALSARSALVVLDNCEHVLDAAADLAEEVLTISPTSRLIATSREGLSVDGEQLVAVPGLDAAGIESAAVALFADRAHSADGSFDLEGDDIAVVEEICNRLDGLPLAIELAAARIGVLSPADLLSRLDERFQVLTGGRRRRSRDRQRTLRETVDWSYDLLADDEQEAFGRLSVFAATFDLDGALAVVGRSDDVEVLDLLEALVDKSLLHGADSDGHRRYRFLETIRSYAEDRLDERGETDRVLQLLQEHLTGLVAATVDAMFTGSADGAARLRLEIPNLRRVFDHALDRHDVEAATHLIAPFADIIGGIDFRISGWADEALALDDALGTPAEPTLVALQAIDCWLDGRFDVVVGLADRMLELAERFGTPTFGVVSVAARMLALGGSDEESMRCWARHRADGIADTDRILYADLSLYWQQYEPFRPGEPAELDARFDVDADVERGLGHPSVMIRCVAFLIAALRAHARGDDHGMLAMSSEASAIGVVGSAYWFASLQVQSWAHFRLGDLAEGIDKADHDLEHAYRYGDRSAMVIPTAVYAMVLRELDEADAAAVLRGWLPRRLTMFMIEELAELDAWLGDALEPDRRRELGARGAAMEPRELQALAHEVSAAHLT